MEAATGIGASELVDRAVVVEEDEEWEEPAGGAVPSPPASGLVSASATLAPACGAGVASAAGASAQKIAHAISAGVRRRMRT